LYRFYAERCLQEPRCRHRAEVYYNDPKKDTPKEFWEQLKKDVGLEWDEKEERWTIRETRRNPTPKTKIEKQNTKPPKA
jgi:hypothetical protein